MPQRSYWAMFSIAPTHRNNVLSVFGVFQCSAITLCLIHDGHHPVGLANHHCVGLIVRLSISFPIIIYVWEVKIDTLRDPKAWNQCTEAAFGSNNLQGKFDAVG